MSATKGSERDPVAVMKSCDRPARLLLCANVFSLPLEYGSHECKMRLTSLHDSYGS